MCKFTSLLVAQLQINHTSMFSFTHHFTWPQCKWPLPLQCGSEQKACSSAVFLHYVINNQLESYIIARVYVFMLQVVWFVCVFGGGGTKGSKNAIHTVLLQLGCAWIINWLEGTWREITSKRSPRKFTWWAIGVCFGTIMCQFSRVLNTCTSTINIWNS